MPLHGSSNRTLFFIGQVLADNARIQADKDLTMREVRRRGWLYSCAGGGTVLRCGTSTRSARWRNCATAWNFQPHTLFFMGQVLADNARIEAPKDLTMRGVRRRGWLAARVGELCFGAEPPLAAPGGRTVPLHGTSNHTLFYITLGDCAQARNFFVSSFAMRVDQRNRANARNLRLRLYFEVAHWH